MEYTLTNAEFVLLLMMVESPGINGYAIRQRTEERGLNAWAGVSSSSIYNGLKRLENRRLAKGAEDSTKRGKGPRGRCYKLTKQGRQVLEQAVAEGLEQTRESDPRFNIALTGIEAISATDAQACLGRRVDFLSSESRRLRSAAARQGRLPVGAALLFDRITHAIESERRWVETALETISASSTPTRTVDLIR